MLPFSDIVEAVKDLVKERFPKWTPYTNLAPKNYKRPSFLVQLGGVEMLDASQACLELEVGVGVLLFTEVDNYGNSKAEELIPALAAVQELFAVEGLRVGDRVLHVTGVRGEPQLDYAQVDLAFHYQDDRPAAGEWPLISEVNINIEEEN